jgi:BR-signaling kinase
MLGVQREQAPESTPVLPRPSVLKDACSRLDLTAIHEFLVKLHYKDDTNESEVCHGWGNEESFTSSVIV